MRRRASAPLVGGRIFLRRVRLFPPRRHLNPGGFDYREFIRLRGVHAEGLASPRALDRLVPCEWATRRRGLSVFRDRMRNHLQEAAPPGRSDNGKPGPGAPPRCSAQSKRDYRKTTRFTVFYSRITPIVLVVATSAFWIVAMGFLLLSSQEKQNEECSHSWEKIRNFTQETIQLRAGAERINDRSAELEVKYKESTEKLKRLGAPSAAVMEESHLPFEEAAEAAPGESWQFEFGGETYALLLLAIEQNPPGARISFRRLPS